jgi:hypothetical protein
MIHVKKVLQYYPLSSKNMPKRVNRERLLQIQQMAEEYGVKEDDVVLGFGYYLGWILRERVREAIRKQKVGKRPMKAVYEPLSRSYQRSKPFNTKNKFWINTGHLVRGIEVWRYKKKVFVGMKGDFDSDVMFWVERGTSKMPARPLLSPLVKMIRKSVGEYWDRFMELVGSGNIRLKPFRFDL